MKLLNIREMLNGKVEGKNEWFYFFTMTHV